jgi:hypothetical protein
MAFTTGTATDWIDLANILRVWMTGTAGWTQLAWTAGNVNTGGMRLSLRGAGAAADKQVFLNFQSVFNDATPAYAWDVRAAMDYNGAVAFGSQLNESAQTLISSWKSTITYWFYANDRRLVMVIKVNTVYLSLYAGFFLPWATPAQYPFPLYVGGSDGILRPYSSTDSAHTSMVDPSWPLSGSGAGDYGSGKVRSPENTWISVANRADGSGNDKPWLYQTTLPFMWPYTTRMQGSGTVKSWIGNAYGSGATSDSGAMDNLVATAQGERMLLPVVLTRAVESAGFGALDGVYFPCGGGGLTPEQTATIGARTFRFFPNIARVSGNDYFAVEEI